jgi:hypothetical protein
MIEGIQNNFSVSKWTKFTFLGWFVGIFLLIGLSAFLDSIGIEKFQFYIGVGLGAGVGFFQWRLLKKNFNMNHEWFWSSVLGMGIPFLIFDLASKFSAIQLGDFYLPLSTCSGAILISVLQFSILKNYSQHATRWIFGCTAGWILAAATVLSIDYLKNIIHNNWVGFFVNITMILGGGVVLGLVTGKVLISILKTE